MIPYNIYNRKQRKNLKTPIIIFNIFENLIIFKTKT